MKPFQLKSPKSIANPLAIFLGTLGLLWGICYYKDYSSGYYAAAVLAACIVTARWAERGLIPDWLRYSFIAVVVLGLVLVAVMHAA